MRMGGEEAPASWGKIVQVSKRPSTYAMRCDTCSWQSDAQREVTGFPPRCRGVCMANRWWPRIRVVGGL